MEEEALSTLMSTNFNIEQFWIDNPLIECYKTCYSHSHGASVKHIVPIVSLTPANIKIAKQGQDRLNFIISVDIKPRGVLDVCRYIFDEEQFIHDKLSSAIEKSLGKPGKGEAGPIYDIFTNSNDPPGFSIVFSPTYFNKIRGTKSNNEYRNINIRVDENQRVDLILPWCYIY